MRRGGSERHELRCGRSRASAGIVISELINRATGKGSEKLSAEEREAQVNLVTSVLAGLTASLDPAALAAINNASRLELENNHLTAAEHHHAPWRATLGKNTKCRDEVNAGYNIISNARRDKLMSCEGTACYLSVKALDELLDGYSARIAEITANRAPGEGEINELAVLGSLSNRIVADRTELLLRASMAGSAEAKAAVQDSLLEALGRGIVGSATAGVRPGGAVVGATSSGSNKGQDQRLKPISE